MSSPVESSASREESVPQSFEAWVKENGGDDSMLSVLFDHGFTSKLSLRYLNLDSSDGTELLTHLSLGQRCLLQGLVRLCNGGEVDPAQSASGHCTYKTCAAKASALFVKGKRRGIKDKINKLFHYGERKAPQKGKKRHDDQCSSDSDDQFVPIPPHHKRKEKSKIGAKSGSKGKNPLKRKVKECRLRVVCVSQGCTRTPADRQRWMKEIWVRANADEGEVRERILQEFQWNPKQIIHYMYAQGKSLRLAKLQDIENAANWDCETIRALMGSGFLYVAKDNVSPIHSDSEEKTEIASDLSRLQEIFKNKSKDELESALRAHGMIGAVDSLISGIQAELKAPVEIPEDAAYFPGEDSGEGGSCSNPIVVDPGSKRPENGQQLLADHSHSVVSNNEEYMLTVDRSTQDNLWMAAISFYKNAKARPHKLKKQLVVHFAQEAAADSGSLRREFFEDALREANNRLFDGEISTRIPKKDWSLEVLMEIGGMMVAHSLVQGGPAFQCLSPAIFDYLVTANACEIYPTKEDIPLDITTHSLISFIEKVDVAQSDDELDAIIDQPVHTHILNGSAWSAIEPVTMASKTRLLQQLMQEEVLVKRDKNLQAFRRGLTTLGVLDLITAYPSLMRPFFIWRDQPLTAQSFMEMVEAAPHKGEITQTAFKFFEELVYSLEGSGTNGKQLGDLLRFVTGLSCAPPLGFTRPIQVDYLPNEPTATLPTAKACFSRLTIPVVHPSSEAFRDAFLTALEHGNAYGSI